jgi:hypothetical protein
MAAGALGKLCKTAIAATKPAESHCGISTSLIMARIFQIFLGFGLLTYA